MGAADAPAGCNNLFTALYPAGLATLRDLHFSQWCAAAQAGVNLNTSSRRLTTTTTTTTITPTTSTEP